MADEFTLESTLGEGAFGKVYLVTNSLDNKQYAMKVIDLRTSPQEEKELAVKESQLLKELNHKNVLAYTDSFEKDGALCIVTEYCAKGDLSEFLEGRGKRKLEEDQLTDWFRQITSALQYLHEKTIIHRDVKTPNIFLTDQWDIKLGDLGLAKVLERPTQKAVTFCGSPYYMSPEIFSCKPYDSKSDIWALGVIVYEMATLERPFDAQLMHQLVFKIVHDGLPSMPTGYKPELNVLLSQIMQKDPLKRPTADEILKHSFFKGSQKPALPPQKQRVDGIGAVSSRWGDLIKRKQVGGDGAAGGGPFDMKTLIGTLSLVRQKDKAKKGGGMKRNVNDVLAAGSDADVGISQIIAKNVKDDKKHEKTVLKKTLMPTFIRKDGGDKMEQLTASVSDVSLDFNQTLKNIQSQTAVDAFNTMQLIVRTMTGVFPNKDEKQKEEAFKRSKDPMGMILRQIEHLQLKRARPKAVKIEDYPYEQVREPQTLVDYFKLEKHCTPMEIKFEVELFCRRFSLKGKSLTAPADLLHYCTKVLNNDVGLFQKAYDMLAREKDEHVLEVKLIQILGPEKFGLCGVQLMFLKNFEYNLDKLRG